MKPAHLLLIVATLLVTSCEKVIDVDDSQHQPVLNGVPSCGQRAFVNFGYSHFFLDTVSILPAHGATLTLTVNGTAYTPDSLSGCNYFFPYTLQPDDQLHLTATVDGHLLEASTYVPRPPQVDGMSIQYFESSSFNFYIAHFNLDDHADYADRYALRLTVRDSGSRRNDWTHTLDTIDTVYSTYFLTTLADITHPAVSPTQPLGGYLYSQLMFLDSLIQGRNVPVDLYIIKLVDTNEIAPYKHWYTISLETLTPDRWQYLTSVAQATDMTSFFAEQGQPYTNITLDGHSGFGIFAGNARYRYTFDADTLSDTLGNNQATAILPRLQGINKAIPPLGFAPGRMPGWRRR